MRRFMICLLAVAAASFVWGAQPHAASGAHDRRQGRHNKPKRKAQPTPTPTPARAPVQPETNTAPSQRHVPRVYPQPILDETQPAQGPLALTKLLEGFWKRTQKTPLTGTFVLAPGGDDPHVIAERVTRGLPEVKRNDFYQALVGKLTTPTFLAFAVNRNQFTFASSHLKPMTFGVGLNPQNQYGAEYGMLPYNVGLDATGLTFKFKDEPLNNSWRVSFEPVESGRKLRVMYDVSLEGLEEPVHFQTFYNRVSDKPNLNLFDIGDESFNNSMGAFTIPTTVGEFVVDEKEPLIATLDGELTTKDVKEGMTSFTLTVRRPARHAGAQITGVAFTKHVEGGAILDFNFSRIKFADGRSYGFSGSIREVKTQEGKPVQMADAGDIPVGASQGFEYAGRVYAAAGGEVSLKSGAEFTVGAPSKRRRSILTK